jgi:hypothetical protein
MIPAAPPALRRALARFGQREEGTATLEMVLCMPVLLMIFMAAFESGLLMTRQIMLERGVDLTVRELRLGTLDVSGADGHEVLKNDICDNTPFLPDCDATIRIELRPVSTVAWNLPAEPTTCFDRDEDLNPSLRPNPGVENELMLIRVCVIQNAIFPGANLGAALAEDSEGGYRLVTVAGFVNEP